MKQNVKKGLTYLPLAVVLSGLAACSGDASFTDSASNGVKTINRNEDAATANGAAAVDADAAAANTESTAGASNNDEVGSATPAKEAALALACAKADVKTQSQVITFEEPSTSCVWGTDDAPVGGNIGLKNQRISARLEQAVELTLPKNAVLCKFGLDFSSGDGQAMGYDDEIYLTFNNILLAASQKENLETLLEHKDGFLLWNWEKLVSTPYVQSDGASTTYCAGSDTGQGKCSIPATETTGTISVSLDDKLVRRAALSSGIAFQTTALTANPAYQFKFITTGDNDDDSDCKHSAFKMTVNSTFITQ